MNNPSTLLRYVGDKSVQILTDLAIITRSSGGAQAEPPAPRFLFEDNDLHHVEVRSLATGELLEIQTVCRDSHQETAGGFARVYSQLPDVDPLHLRVVAAIPVNVYQKAGKLILEGYCGATSAGATEAPVISVFDRDRSIQKIHLTGPLDDKVFLSDCFGKCALELNQIGYHLQTCKEFENIDAEYYQKFLDEVNEGEFIIGEFNWRLHTIPFLALLSWVQINPGKIDDETHKNMKECTKKISKHILKQCNKRGNNMSSKNKTNTLVLLMNILMSSISSQLEAVKDVEDKNIEFSDLELKVPIVKKINDIKNKNEDFHKLINK